MVLAVDIEGLCGFYCKHDVKRLGTRLAKKKTSFCFTVHWDKVNSYSLTSMSLVMQA